MIDRMHFEPQAAIDGIIQLAFLLFLPFISFDDTLKNWI